MDSALNPGVALDRRQAETIARLFNMAYNSAVLYGGNHQATKEGAIVFYNFIFKCISASGTVSIINERESVFIENFCVDKIINTKRLVSHLKKTRIQSISFSSELTQSHVMMLFEVLSDAQKFPTVDEMKKGLTLFNAAGVKLNYVVYRKMTIDEAIVDKDVAEAGAASAEIGGESLKYLAEATDLLTLKQMLEKPIVNFGENAGDTHKTDSDRIHEVVSHIRSINEQVKKTDAHSGFMSTLELGNAVQALKKDIERNLHTIKADTLVEGATGNLMSALDQLSHDVLMNIVRQEYKSGQISLKRLAQIIRRVIPDVKELKRLLPRLKQTLLAEGMEIVDYLKLVTEIRADLDSEGLEQLFIAATDDIGIGPDELYAAIKDDPKDAARLIVLAAEIRKRNLSDTKEFSALLTDYIEQASKSMVLESKDTAGPAGIKLLAKTMDDVKHEILDNIKSIGITEPVISQTSLLLSNRASGELSELKKEWLGKMLDAYKDYSDTDLMRILPQLLHNVEDTALIRDTFSKTLLQKGYTEDKVKEFFEKVAPRRVQADLPKGVLNVSATVYFLEREIKRQQRYATPFSSVIITPIRIWSKRGAPISVGEHETKYVLPQIIAFVRKILRDLDLVGSLGFVSRDIPFIILPMTDQSGANSVITRLEKAFAAAVFECNKDPVTVDCAISGSSFDTKTMENYKQYLEHALLEHKKNENLLLKK